MEKDNELSRTIFICKTCKWYMKAQELELESCFDVTGKFCAGPLAGMDYPNYAGILTESQMKNLCFVCGKPAKYGLKPKMGKRILGVCEEHFKILKRFGRPAEPPKDYDERKIIVKGG